MDEQTRQALKEQLADQESWLRRLDECCDTLDELYVRMQSDNNEAAEAVALANTAVRLVMRCWRQQKDRCTAIKRQLEGDAGGDK